jgi:hypothetical protein
MNEPTFEEYIGNCNLFAEWLVKNNFPIINVDVIIKLEYRLLSSNKIFTYELCWEYEYGKEIKFLLASEPKYFSKNLYEYLNSVYDKYKSLIKHITIILHIDRDNLLGTFAKIYINKIRCNSV